MRLQPDYPVRSTRLLLRPLTEHDIDSLVSYRSKAEVCRYVPFEPMDAPTVRDRLKGPWVRRSLEAEGQALVLGVELVDGGTLVGDVMLRWTSESHRCGEIGYVFDPLQEGRGYATEAVRTVLGLAFDGLGLHRVVARVDAENLASARLAIRLGLRQEAHLVENEWFKGRWSDELDFAILETEWRSRHDDGVARR